MSNRRVRVLLVSTYELGHQPFGIASPVSWLVESGVEVSCLDLSRQPLDADFTQVDFVGFYLPMHTATRLAVPVINRVKQRNPDACIFCFGLYAPLNASYLKSVGVDQILGPEFEKDLVAFVKGKEVSEWSLQKKERIPRLEFKVPDRRALPSLSEYARLQKQGESCVVGYTESSRGCKHHCAHCPIVPIYNGQFRIVATDVVIADIRAQVREGAQHITFGDPDFFNGTKHAIEIVESLEREFDGLTYDVTIKVEHLLRHRELLSLLKRTGCLFVTTAVESFDDYVLQQLRKGHTKDDIRQMLQECDAVGLSVSPTFVPFNPWTSISGYCRFLADIDRLGIVESVASIQLVLRLLLPESSPLLMNASISEVIDPFDSEKLVYPWKHSDSKVEDFSHTIGAVVSENLDLPRSEVFEKVWAAAYAVSGCIEPDRINIFSSRSEVPYLNEPWYC
tara:strand:- start:102 stop:1454 length:1353 start_codon:yes stop_codon:yes gene_type:complete